jgi:hypothetical protein
MAETTADTPVDTGITEQPVADAPEQEVELDDQGNPIEAPAPETVDIVWNGETRKLTRDELIEHAQKGFDYTQKTQSVAEERAAIQAEREAFAQERQIEGQLVQQRAALTAVAMRMQQYEQIDWQRLATDDPASYARLDAEYKVLQRTAAQAGQALQQATAAQADLTRKHQQEQSTRERQALAKAIPETATDESFARFISALEVDASKHYGMNAQALAQSLNLRDHRAYVLLKDAIAFRALQAKAPAPKPATKAPEPPPKVPSGTTPATPAPERMSTDAWMRWRNQQVRKAGRR